LGRQRTAPLCNRIYRVDPYRTSHLDPDYLRWFFLSDGFRDQFLQTVSGVGGSLMRANPTRVAKILLPTAPGSEQRRIVAKIDALSARSKRAKSDLDHVGVLAARAKTALLSRTFSYPGRTVPLDACTPADGPICYGVIQPGEERASGVPLIRVCDLVGGKVAWADLRYVAHEIAAQYRRSQVRNGDILVSIVGTIGRVGVVDGAPQACNIARAIARIRPRKDEYDSTWLGYVLQAPSAQNVMAADAREVARKTLNLALLRELPVPDIPIAQQRWQAEHISRAFTAIDRMAAEARAAARLLDRLDQAVLAKAFCGELVPQHPNDEPASVLLDRIRAEREAASTPKRRGRRARASA